MADFCPHCNPCRHEGEAQDALLRLASWLGQGPGGGEFTTAEDMEARIREGVNAASQPHKSWPSEPTEAMLQDGARAYEHHLDHARPGPHTQAEAMSAAWMAIMSHLSQPHKPGSSE